MCMVMFSEVQHRPTSCHTHTNLQMGKWWVDTFQALSVCWWSKSEACTENLQNKKITGAENHKCTRSVAHRPTHTHKSGRASEKSLMLMCSERQRWCIRWSVELLWVRLCCRVSSSRQTPLSRLCVGVSQGTVGLFCYETREFRPAAAAAFQYFMTCEGRLPGNTAEHFIWGSQCLRIKCF